MTENNRLMFAGGEISDESKRDVKSIPIGEVLDTWSNTMGKYRPELFIPPADTEGRSVKEVLTERLTGVTNAWKRWPVDGPTNREDSITVVQGPIGCGSNMLNQDLCHTLGAKLAESGTYMFTMPPPEELTDIPKCWYRFNKQLRQYSLPTMDYRYFEKQYLGRFRERWEHLKLDARNEVEKAEQAVAAQSAWDMQFSRRYSSMDQWVFNEARFETEIIDRLFFHHIQYLNELRRDKRNVPPISLILLSDNYGHLFPDGTDNIEDLYITQPGVYRNKHRIHQIVSVNSMREYHHSPPQHVYDGTIHVADFTAIQAKEQMLAIAQACHPDLDSTALNQEAAKIAHQFKGYSWGNPHLNSLLCGIATWRNTTNTSLTQGDIDEAVCRVMKCDAGFLTIFRHMIHKHKEPWNVDEMKPLMIEHGYPEDFVYEFRNALWFRGILERGKNSYGFYNVRNCFKETAELHVHTI